MRTPGVGECVALAVAECRRLPIAIDDKARRKKARALFGFVRFRATADLVVAAIQSALVDVVAADDMKLRWETELRFHLTISSFRELL